MSFIDLLRMNHTNGAYNNLVNDACFNLTANNLVDFALDDELLKEKLKGFDKASVKKKQKPLKNYCSSILR